MDSVDLADLPDVAGRTVAEVMVTVPKVHPAAGTTVADARAVLRDDHVHMLLLVDAEHRLVGTVVRDDLRSAAAGSPARDTSELAGRVVGPDEVVQDVLTRLRGAVARRLAVVDAQGRLVGLLCLKRSRRGFCDDAGVLARAAERVGSAQG